MDETKRPLANLHSVGNALLCAQTFFVTAYFFFRWFQDFVGIPFPIDYAFPIIIGPMWFVWIMVAVREIRVEWVIFSKTLRFWFVISGIINVINILIPIGAALWLQVPIPWHVVWMVRGIDVVCIACIVYTSREGIEMKKK